MNRKLKFYNCNMYSVDFRSLEVSYGKWKMANVRVMVINATSFHLISYGKCKSNGHKRDFFSDNGEVYSAEQRDRYLRRIFRGHRQQWIQWICFSENNQCFQVTITHMLGEFVFLLDMFYLSCASFLGVTKYKSVFFSVRKCIFKISKNFFRHILPKI